VITQSNRSTELYDSKFTVKRASTAYHNGKLLGVDIPRYDIGYFGNGLKIEEGTSNYVNNPSFNSGWHGWINAGGSATVSEITTVDGRNAYHIISTGANQAIQQVMNLTAGTVYTMSCYCKVITGQVSLQMNINNNGGTMTYSAGATNLSDTGTGKWVRVSNTFTAGNTANTIMIGRTGGGQNGEYYITDVQVEAKSYATSFTHGLRSQEFVSVPNSTLSPLEGTFEAWVYFGDTLLNGGAPWKRILSTGNSSATGRYSIHTSGTGINFLIEGVGIGTTVPTTGWHYLACKWKAGEVSMFIDGVLKATSSTITLPSAFGDTAIFLGSRSDNGDAINSIIDDVRFSSVSRTDAELQVVPIAPTPIDANTTLKLNFNRPEKNYVNGNLGL